MKSFKHYLKNKKKKDEDGIIDKPIHFKHIGEPEDEDGIIDEPIHFKHIGGDLNDGILDEPIHFKHIVLDKIKKKLEEAAKVSVKPILSSWIGKNDNSHLSTNKHSDIRNEEISKKLRKNTKVNGPQSEAIGDYTDHSYGLNKALIKNKGKLPSPKSDHSHIIKHLDSAIEQNPMKHDLNVYSGTSFDPRNVVGKNKIMKSPAYISTTHSKSVAHGFAKGRTKHILHIALKAGDPALHVSGHSFFDQEHETILSRGTRLKLDKSVPHKNDYGEGGTVYIHHMSVVR